MGILIHWMRCYFLGFDSQCDQSLIKDDFLQTSTVKDSYHISKHERLGDSLEDGREFHKSLEFGLVAGSLNIANHEQFIIA